MTVAKVKGETVGVTWFDETPKLRCGSLAKATLKVVNLPHPNPDFFEVGDVVSINSGGPDMVVVTATEKGKNVEVSWFDETGDLRVGNLVGALLTSA